MRASFSTDTFSHDKLHAGSISVIANKRTLVTPENRTRGAVLGRTATAATVAAAVAAAGNTGDGVVTLGDPAFGGAVQEGTYRVVCVEPASNAGQFVVEGPDGKVRGKATVGVEYDGDIVFTIADGATDFAAGDSFTFAVSAISYKYKLAAAAAVDGSAVPVGILAEDANATDADAECLVYERGDFNEGALTFGTGHTADTVREALRTRDIHLIKSTAA